MVEEKLRAMDRNLLNTQVVVDLQEEGTESLSLQDEEGQSLHNPVLPTGRHEPMATLIVYLQLMELSLYRVLKKRPKKRSCMQQLLTEDPELP